jgi:predicted nucleic acid-binding protein
VGGVADLQRVLAGHRLLALDTMVLAYHLSNSPRYTPLTGVVLEAIEAGQVAGLITTITLAEVLTAPAQAGNRRAMQDYELYLTHFPNLRLIPLDVALARETALVRAATGLRMPDAVNVAAARLYDADAVVTNDRRWAGKVTDRALIILEEYLETP